MVEVHEPILYSRYLGMLQRCHNPKTPAYKNYGGRGIVVCREWRESYPAFESWALANGFSPELSIDRIDVNGPYSPDNCRWTTMKVQANNKRTNLVVFGVSHSMKEWCAITETSHSVMGQRKNVFNWPDEKIVYPELYPSINPPKDATLLRCPSCGGGAISHTFRREEDGSRWRFGYASCRKCKNQWKMDEDDYVKFATRPNVVGRNQTNLALVDRLHGRDEVRIINNCTRCGCGLTVEDRCLSFDLSGSPVILCAWCAECLVAFLRR